MEVYKIGTILRNRDSLYSEHSAWRKTNERIIEMIDNLFIDDKGVIQTKDKNNLAPL